jgi:hypothetical protein
MIEALFGAIAGGLIGSIGTWYVSRRLAFLERRHTQIERASEELQEYRVAYAQFYVEFLSPIAQEERGHWAKPVQQRPDMDYLELERRVDASRGRLRVHRAILRRILRGKSGATASEAIETILRESSHPSPTDCRDIDRMCDNVMHLLMEVLPRR